MRARGAWLAAALAGAVSGAAATLVVGVAVLLATGFDMSVPMGTGGLAGAVSGVVRETLLRAGQAPQARLLGGALAGMAAFYLLGVGAPFGLAPASAPVTALVATLLAMLPTSAAAGAATDPVDLARIGRHQVEAVLINVSRWLGLTFFTVLVAFPFLIMVVTSLKTQAALLANPLDLSVDLGQGLSGLFGSYTEVLTRFRFGRYILVSAFVAVGTVVLTLLFAIPGAYAVARLRFRGREALSGSILLIYMVPAIVLVIPLYAVFSQVGLRNSLFGLLIVYPATTLPVALYMLQGYFKGLPVELEEAGLIDGLSRVGVILRITLPLSLPAIASVALYVFMIAWNEFLFAFMFLDDPGIFTLPRAIVSLNSSEVPRQYLMAGAVIVTVPVLAIFLWAERFMVQGLTAGSVKG